jgi:2'-5' RNA ligase
VRLTPRPETPSSAAPTESEAQARAAAGSYFLAVLLPTNITTPLLRSEDYYKKLILDKFGDMEEVRFHPRNNLHISLIRLGAQSLAAAQQTALKNHFKKYPRQVFNLSVSFKKTWFDDYAGSEFLVYEIGHSNDLENLVKAIDKTLGKKYSSETRHVSIAYFPHDKGDSLRFLENKGKPVSAFCKDSAGIDVCKGFDYKVIKFFLMKSTHTGSVRTYTPIACFRIDGADCTVKTSSDDGEYEYDYDEN